MKNTTSKKKKHTQPSEKTRWAYWMQAIEPTSEAINKAFPDYHPQWVQMSQRFTIKPESFVAMRKSLGLSCEQCAAYLRAGLSTLRKWEHGHTPVPFMAFELLRLISESVRFKMAHPDWDGWFVSENGALTSPDYGRNGFTPDQLNWLSFQRGEAEPLRKDVAMLQSQLDAAIAENTALREMFLDNGVTDEVAAMQDKINALMTRINTARVLPFAPADIEHQPLEKVA